MKAGSSTSASAIAASLFYCLHYQPIFESLQHESKTTFIEVEDIRPGPKLSSCQYLQVCIDGAMHLSPGIAGVIRREMLQGGITIDETYFSAGYDVGVPNYARHHNEAYFLGPTIFKPERLIVTEGNDSCNVPAVSAADASLSFSAFAPLSKREASCVGMISAYQTMST